ncbi:hypothetical protein BJ875DRAFT_521886 [Amylocarpus encephaloides]|uniref:Peptidase S1 domain-containing protein n=1 Tax=Amylocarpus encephaloides TaxID=45428 RepID=A0A9P7YA29_9HELO|nr:hypothetical protein BJ875DRAFT_521886 [Amylocarpus encephaloides]
MESLLPNIDRYYHGFPTPEGYVLQLLGSSQYDAPVEDSTARARGGVIAMPVDGSIPKQYRAEVLTSAHQTPALAHLWDNCIGDIILGKLNTAIPTGLHIDCNLVNISHEPDTQRNVVLIVVNSASTYTSASILSQTQGEQLTTLIAAEANSVLLGLPDGPNAGISPSYGVVVEIAALCKIPSAYGASTFGSCGGVFEISWASDHGMAPYTSDFVLTCHHIRGQSPQSSVESQVRSYDLMQDLKGGALLETLRTLKQGEIKLDLQVPSAPNISASIQRCQQDIILLQPRPLNSKIAPFLSQRRGLLEKLQNNDYSVGICVSSSGFRLTADGLFEDWMVGFLVNNHNLTNDLLPPFSIQEITPHPTSNDMNSLFGRLVVKNGATTGHTGGCINGFYIFSIRYSATTDTSTTATTVTNGEYKIVGKIFQIIGEDNTLFSAPGDSGAAVVDMDGRHTGIINGGIVAKEDKSTGLFTLMTDIRVILNAIGNKLGFNGLEVKLKSYIEIFR